MTFQQEERRRQELRRKEEAEQERRRQLEQEERRRAEEAEQIRRQQQEEAELARRQQEEAERRERERQRHEEEERMRRQEEEVRRRRQEEEERRRRQEEEERRRRQEEEERRRRQDEELRRQAELKRQEELRHQEELKRQEIARYEKLKQEEEAIRAEEMRLEQEMRRAYELQLQQQKLAEQEQEASRLREQELRKAQEAEQKAKDEDSVFVRGHIPKLTKKNTFFQSQERINELNKGGEHLGKVKTGQVNDKRNFWIRSSSADRQLGSQTLSPAPRRRKLDSWSYKQRETEDPDSRPGSALGQPNMGSVRNITEGFLSKSKSSAAVMQDVERGRPVHRTVTVTANTSWTKEKYDQQTSQAFLKSQEVKTNKVNDTITTWGKQEHSVSSGRSTPVPSRNIGQGFAENKLARTAESEKSANSWRTKTPEPSVKLMNVSVERGAGSNQTFQISDSTHSSSSKIRTDEKTVSADSSSTSSFQPPPTPERNQSFGGKCADKNPESGDPSRYPAREAAGQLAAKTCNQARSASSLKSQSKDIPNSNTTNQQTTGRVPSDPNHQFCVADLTVSSEDMNQLAANLQSSTSAQSINSVISTCSSGALPLPVKNAWYDELEMGSVASSSSHLLPEGVLSPTTTAATVAAASNTPVPVTANWFTHSDIQARTRVGKAAPEPLPVATPMPDSTSNTDLKPSKAVADDCDTRSVKSDTTVIENQSAELLLPAASLADTSTTTAATTAINTTNDSCVISVPQSPSEIRRKFQRNSSFEKSFQRSAETELSQEFRAGVKGKVKESRDSFLRRSDSGKLIEAKELREQELQAIKLHRSDSRHFEADVSVDKSEQIRQEKMREFEAIKRSRSQSRNRTESEAEQSFGLAVSQARLEREAELASLSSRRLAEAEEDDDTCFFSPTELREIALREERERELAALYRRENPVVDHNPAAVKEQQIKAERSLELMALYDRTVAGGDQESTADLTSLSRDQLSSRQPTNQQPLTTSSSGLNGNTAPSDCDMSSSSGRVRGTAEIFQQQQQQWTGQEVRSSMSSPPSRRIGSMFRKEPEYWCVDDEFPAPPPRLEADQVTLAAAEDASNPPPPPRQSSRGKVNEYRGWSGGWGGDRHSSAHKHKLH